jgi:predicted transcriptional regulator
MDIQKSVSDLLGSGLSQQELANLVPCGQSTINAYAKGKRGKRPSLLIGQRILELHRERCSTEAELN